jgi:hypothetical protein
VTETALLVAQIAVIAIVFGFVWAVVRSSSRTINRAQPPALPLEDPVERSDTAAHRIPVATRAAAPPPAVATAPDVPPVVAHGDPFAGHVAPAAPVLLDDAPEPEPDAMTVRTREPSVSTAQALAANIEPRLVVEHSPGVGAGTVFPLGGGLTIGRSPSNELHIDDAYVSHMHARILRRGAFYHVEDLGSTNGTYLNDQRIDSGQLRVRDTLRLGETTLRYEE